MIATTAKIPAMPGLSNKEGIASLEECDYDGAIESFKCAMTSLTSCIMHHLRMKKLRLRRSEETFPVEAINFNSLLDDKRNVQALTDEDLFIFRTPLEIPTTTTSFSPSNFSSTSIVLTYNTALAYHLNGAARAYHPAAMEKALELYGMTLGLVLREKNGKNVGLTIAILNNMGHAYNAVGKVALARVFFRKILSLLMIELAAHREDQFGEQLLDGLFTNIQNIVHQKAAA